MKLLRKVGSTSEIWQIFIADSSSTTGAGLTGLAFNTASLTAYYHRDTDTTATAITLVTMTIGTFTSSGFKEIDATNMPGWYQFCPPNAALASGAKSCAFHLKGATNMAPLPIEVDLDGQVDVTHWNGTAVSAPATAGIPDVNVKNINNSAAATPGASGGILISGSNSGTTTLGALTVTGATTCTGNVSMAAGLNITQSSSNTSALVVTGNGTGHGAIFTSGSGVTGDGFRMVAASTNGNGIYSTGSGSGAGLSLVGITGPGLQSASGSTATIFGITTMTSLTMSSNLTVSGTTTLTGAVAASNGSNNIVLGTTVVTDMTQTTRAEPGQGAPAATATPATKLDYIYKAWRNKKTQTATTYSLFADDTTTVDQKATTSDDGTTTTVGEIATGP